jgi:hypothetical protein
MLRRAGFLRCPEAKTLRTAGFLRCPDAKTLRTAGFLRCPDAKTLRRAWLLRCVCCRRLPKPKPAAARCPRARQVLPKAPKGKTHRGAQL